MKIPKITVLMPVYNGEKYLKEAIDSILNQTFTDFEFLIINDGSIDKSVEIIKSYSDPRIKLVHNERNLGLINTLNKGLDLAKGDYIARMDCDDISLPKRFEKQIKYMGENPDVGICGSWIEVFGDKNYIAMYSYNPEEIKCSFIFGTALAHPAVMIRRKFFTKYNLYYDNNFKNAEDFDLWERCSNLFLISNIKEVLLLYREHNSTTKRAIQTLNTEKICTRILNKLGFYPDEKETELITILRIGINFKNKEIIDRAKNFTDKIIEKNKESKYFSEKILQFILIRKWFLILIKNNFNFKILILLISLLCNTSIDFLRLKKEFFMFIKNRQKSFREPNFDS